MPGKDISVHGPHDDGGPTDCSAAGEFLCSVAVAGMASGHSGGTRWRGDDVSLSVVRTTEEPSPRLLRDGRTGTGGAGAAAHGCRGGQSGETAGRRGPSGNSQGSVSRSFC